ncbi:MAG: hypothetical protein JW952_00145 [Candidatus Eisenbacteria bacterium]|nr:hypothetical protein [Candidatus Eisenbacteria bacterium]
MSPYVSSLSVPSFLLGLIRALPLGCVVEKGTVYCHGSGFPFGMHVSLSTAFPLAAFHILAGGGALLLLASPRNVGKKILFLATSLTVYCILRLLILIGIYGEFRDALLLLDPTWTLASMSPFLFFMAAEMPLGNAPLSPSLFQFGRLRTRNALLAVLALSVLVFGLWAVFRFGEPAVGKPGRILVDEAHSNWAWTDRSFGELSFGMGTEYHYGALFRQLQERFDVRRNYDAITAFSLKEIDVLIIKTPSRPFQDSEKSAIRTFVEKGGGLLLVGDHTDVFGSSTVMNELCRSVGPRFNLDAVLDLEDQQFLVWRRQGHLWHKMLAGVPRVCFATSCSVNLSLGGLGVISRGNVYSEAAHYGHHFFYGDLVYSTEDAVGTRCLVAVASRGRGRVAWFSDSTILSNFTLYNPYNAELCLTLLDWLNEAPRWHWFRWVARSGLGLVAVLLIPVLVRRRAVMGHLIAALALSVAGAALVIHMTPAAGELPAGSRIPRAHFEAEHCRVALDERYAFLSAESSTGFHTNQTFYALTQRLGIVPHVMESPDEARSQDIVVFLEPVRRIGAGERRRFESFLRVGGRILVVDTSVNQVSTANDLLADYGLQLAEQVSGEGECLVTFDGTIVELPHARTIIGGTPVLRDAIGRVVVASQRIGKGTIMVMGDSSVFADSSLGLTGRVPDSDELARIKLEFFLLRELLAGDDGRLSGAPVRGRNRGCSTRRHVETSSLLCYHSPDP